MCPLTYASRRWKTTATICPSVALAVALFTDDLDVRWMWYAACVCVCSVETRARRPSNRVAKAGEQGACPSGAQCATTQRPQKPRDPHVRLLKSLLRL